MIPTMVINGEEVSKSEIARTVFFDGMLRICPTCNKQIKNDGWYIMEDGLFAERVDEIHTFIDSNRCYCKSSLKGLTGSAIQ